LLAQLPRGRIPSAIGGGRVGFDLRRTFLSRMEQQAANLAPPASVPPTPSREYLGLAALPDGRVRSATLDATMFATATYAAQLVLFVAGLLQKRLLGPTATGYWALMGTFSVIFNIAPLGTVDGAGRQIPLHRGRGDRIGAAEVADTAATFTISSSVVAGLLLAGVALAFGGGWSPELRYGLVLLGLIAPLGELRDAHEGIMQATKRFNVSSIIVVAQAAITLTVQTLFVWFLGFYGMFCGQVAISLGSLAIWNRLGLTSFRAPAFRWRIDRGRLRELMRYGLPMMLQGQFWVLFLAVDNLIVAAFLSVTQLGYYSLACSATTYIMLLPKTIGGALGPRMAERFGKTNDAGAIGHYGTDVQRVLAYMLLPIAVALAFYGMPVLIRQTLPAFVPAIPVLRIMVAGSFFISLTTMPIKVLLTAGYRWSVTTLTLATLVINGLATYLAVGVLKAGLTGAAVAVSASYFIAFVVMTAYGHARIEGVSGTIRQLAQLIAAFAYTVAALWGIESVIGPGGGGLAHDALVAAVKFLLFVVAVSPLIALVEAETKGLSALISLGRAAIGKLNERRQPK
jgi:O-antigen/teichoic acid export membrane protein